MTELLDESALRAALAELPGWAVEGEELVRGYKFPSYLEGIEFVRRVAVLAEKANHHPDMVVSWRKVTVKLSTHSKGGLTGLDLALARQIEGAVNPGGSL